MKLFRPGAAHIQQSGNAANSAILVDSTNSDPRAMGMRDPPAWSHELLEFRR